MILPLVVFVAAFVPFVRGGPAVEVGPLSLSEAGLATFALVTAKAAIGALSAVLLGATTSFPDILHGLERLRVPRLLTVIAAFMYRYVFVIVDEARRMRAALAARAYRPRHLGQVAAIGRARDRAVPAQLRARRARVPGDARARLRGDDAAARRARVPARRHGVPRGTRC